jgi:pimeloyl-ACP methyl ester carboxylesterase/DNA-binding CsgD family transcriptional regulator
VSENLVRDGRMQKAVTRYAQSGDSLIAYQVVGQGAIDLVLVPAFPSNLEILAEDPGYNHLIQRLSRFCRLILFDPRGSGLSDRLGPNEAAHREMRVADLLALMEATGSGRAVLFGVSDGAAQALHFAACRPERVRALVLYGCHVGLGRPARTPRRAQAAAGLAAGWGTGAALARLAPDRADDRTLAEWWGRLERFSASPMAAAAQMQAIAATEVSDLLAHVEAPTLLLHRSQDAQNGVKASRDLAKVIRGARLVELSGRDHPVWMGDVDAVADQIEEFLTGERSISQGDQVLEVALVARILGASGRRATVATGRHMQERMELLRQALPRIMARHGGSAAWSGPQRVEGVVDGASRAVACAIALRDTAQDLGLALVQGIHAGDVDRVPGIPAGPVPDIAGLIAASGHSADILLSRLVCDLVSGAGLQFVERGALPAQSGHAPIPVLALSDERHLEPHTPDRLRAVDLGILSGREREVLGLVAEGARNPQIAVQLGLSEHTVKRHVANILLKLDLPSRAAAASLAARQAGR